MARTGSRENVEEMNSSPAVLIQHTGHTVGSLSAVICVETDDFCKGRKVFTIILNRKNVSLSLVKCKSQTPHKPQGQTTREMLNKMRMKHFGTVMAFTCD